MKKITIAYFAILFACMLAGRGLRGANLTSEVRIVNGLPALYVDGKLTS